MTKLSELPQVSEAPVASTITWQGKEYAFSVRQVPFDQAQLFNPTLEDGQQRNPRIMSDLVLFEDAAGELVPLDYATAAKLPPGLAVMISDKMWHLNGYGNSETKN